ncbi:MAG: Ig-like domain-containing protein [Cyclobacteriaceae bacterium]
MAKSRSRLILLFLLLLTVGLWAQRGLIVKSGNATVFDPNGDGFVSQTSAGFSNDGYYVDEFEVPMFGVPIVADGDVLNDNQAGAKCGTTDLTVDSKGYSVYGVLDTNNNLIFRFRIGDNKPSVEAYSILIDTDGKFGVDDPNATPNNPGFEIDITLIKNHTKGVYVYDLDGIESCPTPLFNYSFNTHFQIAIADIVSCGNPDYFYDIYVPFADIAAAFGIADITEMRFAAITNVSATCAMAGKISDVGGVDDTLYGGCNSCAFTDLTSNQCPTALIDLCPSCKGFQIGVTPKPTIDTPLKGGELEVTGTSLPGADVFVDVFDVNDILRDQDTVVVDPNGIWLATLTTVLQLGDSVTARAQVIGQCQSGTSSLGTSFTIVVQNQPPVLSAAASPISYTENDAGLTVFGGVTITDPDDTEMDGATVTFQSGFASGEDALLFTAPPGATANYNAATGELTVTGTASLADYQTFVQSIRYRNNSDNPNTTPRVISVSVTDGLLSSNAINVQVDIVPVNDPPVVNGTTNQIAYLAGPIVLDNTLNVTDPDNTQLAGATLTIAQNFAATEDILTFTNQNGITGTYDTNTGVLTLTGTASLADYTTALASIEFSSTAASQLTRRIDVVANDGALNSAAFALFVDFTASNGPPVVVDDLDNPVDVVNFNTLEDTPLNACLTVIDPDGDIVNITNITKITDNGTFVLTGGLCFTYTPNADFFGEDRVTIEVCDQTTPSLCDQVEVVITVQPVNDPPVIDVQVVQVDEGSTTEICISVTDKEGDPAVFNDGTSAEGTVIDPDTGDLCFDFTPDDGYLGDTKIDVTVCDANDPTVCSTGEINVTVIPLPNKPPDLFINGILGDTLRVSTPEDSTLVFCFEAIDPNGDDVTLLSFDPVVANGTLTYANIEFCFEYTPTPDFNGFATWTADVCDDRSPALCSRVVMIIEVTPVNDPPVLTFTPVDVLEGTTQEICITYTDVENNNAAFSTGLSANGTTAAGPSGGACFDFTPTAFFNGNTTIDVTICDENDATVCTTGVQPVYVIPAVNLPPDFLVNGTKIDTLFLTTLEDTNLDFCFQVEDPNRDPVTLLLVSNNEGGGTLNQADPSAFCFGFSPVEDFFGNSIWSLEVCDNRSPSLCSSLVVLIDVQSVNDAPTARNDTVTVLRYVEFFGNVMDNDFDKEGNAISIQTLPVAGPFNGNITLDVDGVFAYRSGITFRGLDSVRYSLCDDGVPSACSEAVLWINVDDLPLKAYEGITPNGDGNNDYWRIDGIDYYLNNQVRIFDRWNNLVFEISGYNNENVVWTGQSNKGAGGQLAEGTYFYSIKLNDGKAPVTGFVMLKRK